MKKLKTALPALTAICLVLPASGLAGLPKPKDPTIEVAKSLGGVKIGMKDNKAIKQWSKSGDCQITKGDGVCTYIKGKDLVKGSGTIQIVDGKVASVSIAAGSNSKGKLLIKGPLGDFQTPEGIGLGDKGKRIKKAYKKTKVYKGSGYQVPGKGKSSMFFAVNQDGEIASINLIDGKHQG